MKRFNITESDRNQILDLHKKAKLNEAEVAGVALPVTQAELVGGKTTTNTAEVKPQNYTIKNLQELLNQRGYNVGTADGFLGKNTLAQIQNAISNTKVVQATLGQQQGAQAVTTTTTTQSPIAGLPVPEPQQSNEPEIKATKSYVSGQVTDKMGTKPNILQK